MDELLAARRRLDGIERDLRDIERQSVDTTLRRQARELRARWHATLAEARRLEERLGVPTEPRTPPTEPWPIRTVLIVLTVGALVLAPLVALVANLPVGVPNIAMLAVVLWLGGFLIWRVRARV